MSAKINNGSTIPLELRPGTAVAMNVTPSRPTPASPAFETPAQNAAMIISVHCITEKSGMEGMSKRKVTR